MGVAIPNAQGQEITSSVRPRSRISSAGCRKNQRTAQVMRKGQHSWDEPAGDPVGHKLCGVFPGQGVMHQGNHLPERAFPADPGRLDRKLSIRKKRSAHRIVSRTFFHRLGSPVRMDSSRTPFPAITLPSRGILSPAMTRKISPGRTASAETHRSFAP